MGELLLLFIGIYLFGFIGMLYWLFTNKCRKRTTLGRLLYITILWPILLLQIILDMEV